MDPSPNPFGTIDRVGPAAGASSPQAGFSALLVAGINIALGIGGIAVLIYLLWGALDYVTSGGEEEKIENARKKMTYAIIGGILLIVALSAWTVVTGSILGIVQISDRGYIIDIPRVGCLPEGAQCSETSSEQCCSTSCSDPDGNGVFTCDPQS